MPDQGEFARGSLLRFVPLLFLAAATMLVITLVLKGTFEISAAIVLIGLGCPVFLFMRARRAAARSR